eukprot:Skav205057  [mRNA]  locus=scaffold142:206039:207560:+ [translate_table: standard]
MRALWIAFFACLTCSDAIRESVVDESVVGHATVVRDGDDCTCGKEPLDKNTCCGTGLICSKTAGKCKPALKAECDSKWFGTNCAVSTYSTNKKQPRYHGIACKKYYAATDGKKRCCVEGLPITAEPHNRYQYIPIGDKTSCHALSHAVHPDCSDLGRFGSSSVADCSVPVKQHYMYYAMRALWIAFFACLPCSDAIRQSVVESVGGNATVLSDGDDCTCGKELWQDNTCCGTGLICSNGKCKPALKAVCKWKLLGTNCARRPYRRGNGIVCNKYYADGKKRCCIQGLPTFTEDYALYQYRPLRDALTGHVDDATCCSGKTRWIFDKEYCD